MNIPATGGAGHIGNQLRVALLDAGFAPFVPDAFSNSRPAVFERIAAIAGRVPVAGGDIGNEGVLEQVFADLAESARRQPLEDRRAALSPGRGPRRLPCVASRHRARREPEKMMADAWRWCLANPDGRQ